ncbi:MAG: putative sulfate exporter family transporter [Proteobacteria bacterium]|nr:putative sulfate exporter family transporter [Pseudomonadota bacterium]
MADFALSHSSFRPRLNWDRLPGVLLCAAIAVGAYAAQDLEVRWLGRAWLEALVLAILIGAAVRAAWTPGARFQAGIAFCAKTVLEVAVVLLGATISGSAILRLGPALLIGVPLVVATAILASYGLGRLLRMPHKMALLIACGNAICGNSAIAAIAPVIDADGDDVAAAIAFTAVLGVVVVLLLPVLAGLFALSPHAFGVLAGLTVYAVPQVLAATAPVSSLSAQVGAVVKLVRVLMLGPVVLAISCVGPKGAEPRATDAGQRPKVKLRHLVPWFIVAFLVLIAVRSAGLLPAELVQPASTLTGWLTVVAMAALGLAVDLPAMAKVGPRAAATVTLSLAILGVLAFGVLKALSLA